MRDKDAAVAAILSAAESEFARYGLQGARVDAIAKTAGVTKGLIFHYFESKEKLFDAILRSSTESLQALIAEVEVSNASPDDLLRMLVEGFLRALIKRPLSPLIFTLEMIQNRGEHYRKLNAPSIHRTLKRVLARGVKQGCFRKLDPACAAINIVGICTHYFYAASIVPVSRLNDDPYSQNRLARHAREVMRFVKASTAAAEV